MATIGIIGAGKIGSQLARLAVKNGHKVVISNSRGPATLSGLVAELGPNARAATAAEAGAAGEIVVVTVPLKNYRAIPALPLLGKIVIDTNNYYPQRDGHIPSSTTSRPPPRSFLQAHLPTSKVVKAFNHIYAADLTTNGQPAGSKNRRALSSRETTKRPRQPSVASSTNSASTSWTPARSKRDGASSAIRPATAATDRRGDP